MVGLYPIKWRCDSEMLLSSGAKPWCDVPAAASNSQASAAWLARRRRGGARCLWGGDAALELASHARGAAMVVVGPYPAKRRCDGETAPSLGARPWCDVPAAASNFKPAPRDSRDAGASALSVSGKEAQHSACCARAVLRWSVICLLPTKGRCDSERPLSFGAQPWCDVPAAASNFKPAPRGLRGAGAAALAVSGEETQHSSLLRVRVVPRWL